MDYNLQSDIIDLIELKYEGQFWDFKQEWYINDASLLHDILCLSNTIHNGDRYIIVGIDNQFNVCGVDNDVNRKNQQNLITFLRDKKFAGDNRPSVGVKTIQIDNKDLDIIVVKNTPAKPYYIAEDYRVQGKNVRANYIYSRVGDTNTPIDKQCDQNHIEQIWRERFGLLLTPYERLLNLLDKPSEWKQDKEDYHHHKLFPEFRVEFDSPIKIDKSCFPFPYCYTNESSGEGMAKFYYHSTILYESQYIYCDEYRLMLPMPEMEHNEQFDTIYYYLLDEFSGIFLKYLRNPPLIDFDGKSRSVFSSGRFGYAPFLVFKSKSDLNDFIAWTNDPANEKTINNLAITKFLNHTSIPSNNPSLKQKVEGMYKVEAVYNHWLSATGYSKVLEYFNF